MSLATSFVVINWMTGAERGPTITGLRLAEHLEQEGYI